jgi:polysaccharide biosynthesis protein PelA
MNLPMRPRTGEGGGLVRRTVLQASAALTAMLSMQSTGSCAATASERQLKWLAFYGQTADERVLASYDVVVLDPMFQGCLAQVGKDGARLCGYISLGEVRVADSIYAKIDPAVLIEENPAWPGTHRIDVRHPSWSALVLEEVIPRITGGGFTGLFLDTLDTPAYLEQVEPEPNRGMRQAAIDLVQSIRNRYPDLFVIINRGYALLPDIAASVDAIVAESLLTVADDRTTRGYRWNSPSEVAQVLSLMTSVGEGEHRVPWRDRHRRNNDIEPFGNQAIDNGVKAG